MSIATLKKKTQARYNNMSVGSKHGFSLNGTHRSQGYVGQSVLGRSLPRTLMNGNVARGYGGCCGQFQIFPIVQSAVTSLNDPSVVKSTVMNTHGMIDTKYKGPQYNIVKPDNNQNINSQYAYIANVAKIAINDNCHTKDIAENQNKCGKPVRCVYTKPESDYVAKSAGEYLLALDKKCTDNNVFYVPTNTNRTPFVGNN